MSNPQWIIRKPVRTTQIAIPERCARVDDRLAMERSTHSIEPDLHTFDNHSRSAVIVDFDIQHRGQVTRPESLDEFQKISGLRTCVGVGVKKVIGSANDSVAFHRSVTGVEQRIPETRSLARLCKCKTDASGRK